MNQLSAVSTPHAPQAIGPYSQAVTAGGVVYCSGQISLDPVSGAFVGGDVRAETEQVLKNLSAILEAAGSSLSRVVKTTVFLADIEDFAAMNEVYARFFGDHRPARATVAVRSLPRNARVEIEAIALVG